MSSIETLKRAANAAKSAHDELIAAIRRGEHVAQSELGQANREFVAADAALIAAEEAAVLAAKADALMRMAPSDYEAERAKLTGGIYRRALI